MRAAVIAAGCAALFPRQPTARGHLLCRALSGEASCAPSARARARPGAPAGAPRSRASLVGWLFESPQARESPPLPKPPRHRRANRAVAVGSSSRRPPRAMRVLAPRGTAALATLPGRMRPHCAAGLRTPRSHELLLALRQGLLKNHLGKTDTGTGGASGRLRASLQKAKRQTDACHPSPGAGPQGTARACRLSLSPAPKSPAFHNQTLLGVLRLQQTFRSARGSVQPEKKQASRASPCSPHGWHF